MINGIMNTINISGPARITHSAGMPDTVIYCNSGNGSILHDGSVKPFTADDIVIIPSSEEAVLTGDTDLYLMSFDHLTPGFGHITVVTHEDNIRIKQLFPFVAGFDSHSPRVTRAVIPALGRAIASYLAVLCEPGAQSDIVKEIEADILAHFTDPEYDLPALLESLPFSCDHMTKLFKREMGVTPHQYLTDRRLSTAMDWLSSYSGSNIAEIAHSCGFKDPLYFSRQFRKKYGISPSFCRETDHTPPEGPAG